ncbi:predicted protein [Sclerotinia sclerotiorum 1980 UF-70]|nr:predicted protein [Sclerotinia sclerotiorum 1980 UF-70]EDN96326.1 predicted protein [Sclerotinia sclerotiorum 1980 UF-70]
MSDHASETSDDSASGSKDDHGHLTISDPIKSASNSIEITAYCEENPSTAGAPSSVKESDFLKTDKQIQDEGLSFWAN